MATFQWKKYVAFVLSMAFIVPAYAQTKQYTLTELINLSENYLPSLIQKQALIKGEQAEVASIKHSFLPAMYVGDEVSIGSDNSLAGSYLPEIAVPTVSAGVADANNTQSATGNIVTFYSQY